MSDDCEDYGFSDDEVDQQDDDLGLEEEEEEIVPQSKPRSRDEASIRLELDAMIDSVASTLSVPTDTASIMLRNFGWDRLKLQELWFSDETRVREISGLVDPEDQLLLLHRCKKARLTNKVECMICFTNYALRDMEAAGCGHLFCNHCWDKYVANAVEEGPGCLTLRCPEYKCLVSVEGRIISKVASAEVKERYDMFLVRNFVECSNDMKWCPAPGCSYAVEFYGSVKEVNCECSYLFCWNCVGEWHSPVDCETAKKWHAKNRSDAGNAEWILANSKPCPKCQRSIEKNQGCNHMTCTAPCRHQFCWTCMGPWDQHTNGAGYRCNQYTEDPEFKKKEKARKDARVSWQRYNHYYERWMTNSISWEKAVKSLKEEHVENMKKFSAFYSETEKQLEEIFVSAWKQIIECRRVLKWTYAYGYYLPENDVERKHLFENLQGYAEFSLERLHHWAEAEMKLYLEEKDDGKPEKSQEAFAKYKLKLFELTSTTRLYFDNLVKGLESGLEEVSAKC